MGSGGPRGARPPSHVPYYVAMVGIMGLLLLLCFYFFYYFIKRVKELSTQESPLQSPAPTRAPPAPVASPYPIQPVVRDSATAMAKLCKQLPAPTSGKGGARTVFPASTSPAAQHTGTSDEEPVHNVQPAPYADKIPPGPEVPAQVAAR